MPVRECSLYFAGSGCPRGRRSLRILERAVKELCLLASTVIERLELQRGRLALSGGVLKNDAYVTEGVKAQLGELYPELESFLLATSAAIGAARMALAAVQGGM